MRTTPLFSSCRGAILVALIAYGSPPVSTAWTTSSSSSSSLSSLSSASLSWQRKNHLRPKPCSAYDHNNVPGPVASTRAIRPRRFVRPTTTTTTTTCFLQADDNDDDDNTATTATAFRRNQGGDDRQAGRDGYSVLRQPLSQSSWDPDTAPEYQVPWRLRDDDDDEQRRALEGVDESWWKRSPSAPSTSSSRASNAGETYSNDNNNNNNFDMEPEEENSLDLLQRSLDAMDFGRILKALAKGCTTVPGRELITMGQSSSSSSSSSQPEGNSGSSTAGVAAAAWEPLLATSAAGARRRYRAVQEMQRLLLVMDNHGTDRDSQTTTTALLDARYRDRRGITQEVAGRPPPLGGSSYNLRDILTAVREGGIVLEGSEFLEISSILNALENLVLWNRALEKINTHDNDEPLFVEIPRIINEMTVNATLQDLLEQAVDDQGRLSGETFTTVGRLRREIQQLRAEILETLNSLVTLPSMQSQLAMESGGPLISEINGRLVVPLQSDRGSARGIVHDSSRSGKTVYVEPTEIVSSTNELRQLEGELGAEEARIWRYLTQQILDNAPALEQSLSCVGQLDLVLARVRLGQSWHGVVPVVREEGAIVLKNAKHPVLLLRKNEDVVVGSDLSLGAGDNQGLVLTGPNAGGKTVIMKLLGLAALLSRAGIPVPAAAASSSRTGDGDDSYQPRVDFFDPVLVDIGDTQSVGDDLSTFSGHLLVCREILEKAGPQALVLMDEIGSGTDPNQGAALAQAMLEAFLETGARVAITTHYVPLKQLAASDARFAVAGMQFVRGRPTYKLIPGAVGESYALAAAERLKLPTRVTERANELLDSDTRQMGDLLRQMEDQKAAVDELAMELEEKRKDMIRMEQELKEQQMKMERKQLTVRREEAKKFAKKLEEKEQVLENILEKLKSDPSRRILAKSWDDIKFVKRDALNEAENVPSVLARKKEKEAAIEEVSAELVPLAELRVKPALKQGDKVVVCKKGPLFAREGSVVKVLGNRMEISVNKMRATLKMTEVALPPANGIGIVRGPNPGAGGGGKKRRSRAVNKALEQEGIMDRKRRNRGGAFSEAGAAARPAKVHMRTDSNTIDVRGSNLMQAQEKIKQKFSKCLMNGRPVVYILHGHGTGGVLKSKLRQWLKTQSNLVKSFGPADAADGGDAFTRVEL